MTDEEIPAEDIPLRNFGVVNDGVFDPTPPNSPLETHTDLGHHTHPKSPFETQASINLGPHPSQAIPPPQASTCSIVTGHDAPLKQHTAPMTHSSDMADKPDEPIYDVVKGNVPPVVPPRLGATPINENAKQGPSPFRRTPPPYNVCDGEKNSQLDPKGVAAHTRSHTSTP